MPCTISMMKKVSPCTKENFGKALGKKALGNRLYKPAKVCPEDQIISFTNFVQRERKIFENDN